MSNSLHLLIAGTDIHLRMPDEISAEELLSTCSVAMRDHRVVDFPDTLAPGAVRRGTVVIHFEHVAGVWIEGD